MLFSVACTTLLNAPRLYIVSFLSDRRSLPRFTASNTFKRPPRLASLSELLTISRYRPCHPFLTSDIQSLFQLLPLLSSSLQSTNNVGKRCYFALSAFHRTGPRSFRNEERLKGKLTILAFPLLLCNSPSFYTSQTIELTFISLLKPLRVANVHTFVSYFAFTFYCVLCLCKITVPQSFTFFRLLRTDNYGLEGALFINKLFFQFKLHIDPSVLAVNYFDALLMHFTPYFFNSLF